MALYPSIKRAAARLQMRWKAFASTRRGRRMLRGARYALTASVVGYLGYRLTSIGWIQILASLPRTPWFYVIFAAMYLTLPVFQSIIYGLIFDRSPVNLFPAALKKRVYNKDVMSYSGEVYLYFWIRKRVAWADSRIMHAIKDNAIVSSVASTIVAFGVLAIFLFSGLLVLPDAIARHEVTYLVGALLIGVILTVLGVKFRHYLLRLSARLLLALFGLHMLRLLVVQGLQVLEWAVVVPDVRLEIWFTFLAVQIMTSRIPFLPSRDLIFMAAGIELAGAVQVSKAAIAGVLGVHSVLDKVLNALLFAAVSAWDRRHPPDAPAPEDVPADVAAQLDGQALGPSEVPAADEPLPGTRAS